MTFFFIARWIQQYLPTLVNSVDVDDFGRILNFELFFSRASAFCWLHCFDVHRKLMEKKWSSGSKFELRNLRTEVEVDVVPLGPPGGGGGSATY